jgi:hypothetical protein
MKVIKDTGVPPWESGEISVVDFKTKLDAVRALLESESDELADTIMARGSRDANLTTLRDRGRDALANLRRKHRKDPVRQPVLAAVSLDGVTVTATVNEARKFSSVWAEIDPTYVAEDGLTLAAYDALRTTCGTNQESVGKEGAEEAVASGKVKAELDDLYDVCVAWYDTATRKYKEGTPFGIMIRRHVPVTPTSGLDKPGPTVLTVEPGIGQATLTPVAENALTYTILTRLVGETDWQVVVVAHESGSFLHTGLGAGFREYKAVAHNHDGDGPESEVVTVEVT